MRIGRTGALSAEPPRAPPWGGTSPDALRRHRRQAPGPAATRLRPSHVTASTGEDWRHPGGRQRLCASGDFEHLHRRGRGLRVHSGQRLGRQTELGEDAFDDGGLLEEGDDLPRPVAARARHPVSPLTRHPSTGAEADDHARRHPRRHRSCYAPARAGAAVARAWDYGRGAFGRRRRALSGALGGLCSFWTAVGSTGVA
jgi:hypothetical protein